eukprot:8170824-Pyramimonas_sp.AAC.1
MQPLMGSTAHARSRPEASPAAPLSSALVLSAPSSLQLVMARAWPRSLVLLGCLSQRLYAWL